MSNPTLPSPTPTVAGPFQQPPVLTQIQQKVRRLTRSPSTAQLSDADLNNYINTFVVYDFPEQLRTFNLKTEFNFYTNPFQDVYNTDEASFGTNPNAVNNPLYNFQNLYLTVNPPCYIGGFQAFWSQSPQQFFGIYPQTNSIQSIGTTGDGLTQIFTGTVNINGTVILSTAQQNVCLRKGEVTFTSIDVNGLGLTMVDVPVIDANTGLQTVEGNLYDPYSAAYKAALQTPPTATIVGNTINYVTGVFTVTFSAPPGAGATINSQTLPLTTNLPQAIMFYSNQFTVRPCPDQPYRINFEVLQRPTALLAANQAPELEEYWQLLAYGASIKIFQDRMDLESVQLIYPEYNNQLRLCLRRTIVQRSNQRTQTIYSQQSELSGGNSWWGGIGGPF